MSPHKGTSTPKTKTTAEARRQAIRLEDIGGLSPQTEASVTSTPQKKIKKSDSPAIRTPSRSPAKSTRLQNWNYSPRPIGHEERAKNGRVKGRATMNWNKPRMMERLMLFMRYECWLRGVELPWDHIAHRLEPGVTGDALLQKLERLRKEMTAEGHLVPPGMNRNGNIADHNIRGFVRRYPEDPEHLLEIRPVTYQEPFEDVMLADSTAVRLRHNRSTGQVAAPSKTRITDEEMADAGNDDAAFQSTSDEEAVSPMNDGFEISSPAQVTPSHKRVHGRKMKKTEKNVTVKQSEKTASGVFEQQHDNPVNQTSFALQSICHISAENNAVRSVAAVTDAVPHNLLPSSLSLSSMDSVQSFIGENPAAMAEIHGLDASTYSGDSHASDDIEAVYNQEDPGTFFEAALGFDQHIDQRIDQLLSDASADNFGELDFTMGNSAYPPFEDLTGGHF